MINWIKDLFKIKRKHHYFVTYKMQNPVSKDIREGSCAYSYIGLPVTNSDLYAEMRQGLADLHKVDSFYVTSFKKLN